MISIKRPAPIGNIVVDFSTLLRNNTVSFVNHNKAKLKAPG